MEEFRRIANESTKAAPSADAAPEITEVKPKSPNALERIALDDSYHNSSIESTPKIRKIEKKKLKIIIKSQEKPPLLSSDQNSTGQSLIGPLLPSLYDDEEDILVQGEVKKEEVVLNGNEGDKEASNPIVEVLRETGEKQRRESKSEESKNDSPEVLDADEIDKRELKPCGGCFEDSELPIRISSEENSNSGREW